MLRVRDDFRGGSYGYIGRKQGITRFVSLKIWIETNVNARLTTCSPLLLQLPCSLRLSDQFLLVVGGAVDVGLGSLGLERSEVVPAIEDTREERGVPDNL